MLTTELNNNVPDPDDPVKICWEEYNNYHYIYFKQATCVITVLS